MSGAAAERALSARHRDAWPRNLYAYDRDELRADGRLVLVEAPAGTASAVVEYKPYDAALDLDGHQATALRTSSNPALPALVVQFTHPAAGLPWAFKVTANNRLADHFLAGQSWTFTEQAYVALLYVIRDGFAAPGTAGYAADPTAVAAQRHADEARTNTYEAKCATCRGVVPARRGVLLGKETGRGWRVVHERCAPGAVRGRPQVAPQPLGFTLEPFAHLDNLIPDVAWANIIRPRRGWDDRTIARAHAPAVRRYLEEHGRPEETLADVLPFPIPDRPALGAFRQARTAPIADANGDAGAQYRRSLNDFQLARAYDRMWASERPSDDNRQLWRR